MTKVTTLRTPKGYTVANHFVISNYDRNKRIDKKSFQSFNSIICLVDDTNKKIIFGKDFDYSITTSKYTSQFFSDVIGIRGMNRATIRKAINDKTIGCYQVDYNKNLQ